MGERTTIVFDEEIMRRLRLLAAERGLGLSRLIGDLLKSALKQEESGQQEYRFDWPTTRGRLLPGVDLGDRDRLYDIMEGRG